jgi:hypothetical protein
MPHQRKVRHYEQLQNCVAILPPRSKHTEQFTSLSYEILVEDCKLLGTTSLVCLSMLLLTEVKGQIAWRAGYLRFPIRCTCVRIIQQPSITDEEI